MVDMQQLRALVELSRLGAALATAESLGFSQSTVSHRLAALSCMIDVVLLTRIGHDMRFIEEGQALAVRGQEVLNLPGHTEREVVPMARVEAGCVRSAIFPSVVASLMPGVLDVVDRQYSSLEVELVDIELSEVLEALRRGRMDAALSFSYVDDDAGEGLQAEHLLNDILYLVTRPGDTTYITDNIRCRWVTGYARCYKELLAVGRANGLTPKTAHTSDDCAAVQAFVTAGVGITLLPGMALSAYWHEGVQMRLLTCEQRCVKMAARAGRLRPLATDVLVGAYQAAAHRTNLRRSAVATGGSTASQ